MGHLPQLTVLRAALIPLSRRASCWICFIFKMMKVMRMAGVFEALNEYQEKTFLARSIPCWTRTTGANQFLENSHTHDSYRKIFGYSLDA